MLWDQGGWLGPDRETVHTDKLTTLVTVKAGL